MQRYSLNRLDLGLVWKKPNMPAAKRCMTGAGLLAILILSGCGTPAPVEPPLPPPKKTTFVGVGDILLGRKLGERMFKAKDYTLGFLRIQDELTSADITFGNLEGPFCDRGPFPGEGMI